MPNFKNGMPHVAKEMALSPVDSQKYPCCMSLTILSAMWHVIFKKEPCPLSLRWPCRMSKLRNPVKFKKWLCRPVDLSGLHKLKLIIHKSCLPPTAIFFLQFFKTLFCVKGAPKVHCKGPATRCDEIDHFAAILRVLGACSPSQPIAGLSLKIAAVWPVSYPRWSIFVFSCDAHCCDGN